MGINKETFTKLLKSGRVAHSGFLSIRFINSPVADQIRENQYSFVVSTKVSKLATVRNLLKRRSRAIIFKHREEIVSPLICAFFFKNGSNKLSFKELEGVILSILKQVRLLK